MSETQPFWTSLHDRDPDRLRDDGDALVEVAERGLAHAARDVSMPGIAGSLLQMLEARRLRRDARRRPPSRAQPASPLERWLLTFPSFGFLLAARAPERRAKPSPAAGSPPPCAGPSTTRGTLRLGRVASPRGTSQRAAHRTRRISIGWC